MEISYRLKKIAENIQKDSSIADIGTDHAYIPIYMCKNNTIKKAIACDISKGSLQKAKDNIKKYNLNDKIETRLSNGLEKISIDDDIDTIIIAGMGGMLMIDILKNGIEICKNAKELILQPQKDTDKVRQYLHSSGYKIVLDEMIKDEGKFYTIIKAINGLEEIPYTKQEYIFGRYSIKGKNIILKEYIEEQINKMKIVLKNLKITNSTSRIIELEENIKLYEEVLKCL